MFDVERIRKDFPILEEKIQGKTICYLDSACMALKPKQVINAMLDYYTKYTACGGRSAHYFALKVTEKFEEAREEVAKFINAAEASEIVWTRNTTESMNIIMNTVKWEKGDEIISDETAHNSNLIPWIHIAKKKGLIHKLVPMGLDASFDLEKFSELITSKTKLVSLCQVSNVTGHFLPVKEISKIVHDHGGILAIDGAQSFPHMPVDVQDLDVDFFGASMHKACGPTGVGILYGKYQLLNDADPYLVGGETVSDVHYPNQIEFSKAPGKFEAGLQDYAGVIGTGAAISYLNSIGMEAIHDYELELSKKLWDVLTPLMDHIKILGPKDPEKRAALAAIVVKDINSHEIGMILDEEYKILLRAGYHCTHAYHHKYEIVSTFRPSFYFYNTMDEVEKFGSALKEILELFGVI